MIIIPQIEVASVTRYKWKKIYVQVMEPNDRKIDEKFSVYR